MHLTDEGEEAAWEGSTRITEGSVKEQAELVREESRWKGKPGEQAARKGMNPVRLRILFSVVEEVTP